MKRFLFGYLLISLAFSTISLANDKIVGGELVDASNTETRYIVSIGG
jgi:hypothetical protein